ncbi:alpha/beta-hydrolase [Sistotremastrum suecicum HHB10207 ss-3]|uniref:Alpha/beta-hydrolase n=1 Tax=Sistotremastrum suecicum HHB10207 ss-3 TaxID=1314776 RepID=A0A166HTK0_9AGAM|nr:alpha/beta-hydrolase [Sistotremastrum suecicum HHB10207 ss-3]
MSLCPDCIKGVKHEGTPTGKVEKIAGVDVYVALPENNANPDKAILFLPDVFGHALPNAQLLADDFANNGFATYLIDLFQGDYLPADALSTGFNIGAWFPNHGPEKVTPAIDAVYNALKEKGITRFGATGYCFGARYVFNYAFENKIQVSVTAHPSLLQVPADIEKYLAVSKAPLLINSCTTDTQFPHEAQAKTDEILGDGKFAPGYKREYWKGCTHGFAVRGDPSDPVVKAGKEGAFEASVRWFKQHL